MLVPKPIFFFTKIYFCRFKKLRHVESFDVVCEMRIGIFFPSDEGTRSARNEPGKDSLSLEGLKNYEYFN